MAETNTLDVAIVGGGLAGSFAATVLGKSGYSVAVIDPSEKFPDEFRCEKFGAGHLKSVERTGLGDALLAVASPNRGPFIARRGRIVERSAFVEYGIRYVDFVNFFRESIPDNVECITAKVTGVETSDDIQRVTLSDKRELSARLVIMANGLNTGLREQLGMARKDLSPTHSITIGFDIEPVGREAFDIHAITYFGEDPIHRVGYITLFPIGNRFRANLFVYRDIKDPWLRKMKDDPQSALAEVLPHLEATIGAYRVATPIKFRPIDIYQTEGYLKPGIALVGDACGTACPAAGTGAMKALVDVERLCNAYVPKWLETPGMGVEKIAEYYADPEKHVSDARSLDLAFHYKNLAVMSGLMWQLRRAARYVFSCARQTWRDVAHITPQPLPLPAHR